MMEFEKYQRRGGKQVRRMQEYNKNLYKLLNEYKCMTYAECVQGRGLMYRCMKKRKKCRNL